MAAFAKSVFGGFQAFRAWAYNRAARAEIARQTAELGQTRRTKTGRTLMIVGAALATLASHAAAQTFNAATTRVTTEGNALITNIVTVLIVAAGIAFLIGVGMVIGRQRGGWYAIGISMIGLLLIPIRTALPALAR